MKPLLQVHFNFRGCNTKVWFTIAMYTREKKMNPQSKINRMMFKWDNEDLGQRKHLVLNKVQ